MVKKGHYGNRTGDPVLTRDVRCHCAKRLVMYHLNFVMGLSCASRRMGNSQHLHNHNE